MTRTELWEKITGVPKPKFINKRENAIVSACLEIITKLEDEKQELYRDLKDLMEEQKIQNT